MSSKHPDAASENMMSESPAPASGRGDDSATADNDRGADKSRGPELASPGKLHDRIWLARLMEYTWKVNRHTNQEDLMALVADLVGQDIEQTMETLEQLLRPEVFEKGSEKRERELLLRLLMRRFGVLPEFATQRVAGASTEDIERWFDRAVDATSLDDVFATP